MAQDIFLKRVISKIFSKNKATIIIADSRYGGPHIFQEIIKKDELCIWIKLEPEDKDDSIAQGNTLSDAVTRSLGSHLFGHAMPYNYGLSVLQANIRLFEPLTIILSNADYAPDFAHDLLSLHSKTARVIIAFEKNPKEFLIPEDAVVIQEKHLKLNFEEAFALAADHISEIEIANLLQASKARFEPFMLELNKIIGLPTPLRPGPAAFETPPDASISVPPKALLQISIRRQQWLEALELAVEHEPEKVSEFIDNAAEVFIERGLYQRLWNLLDSLPDHIKNQERILFWQLTSASRIGKLSEIQARVKTFLADNESADLRARYATGLSFEEGLIEVKKAYQAAKTFSTLQHYAIHLMVSEPAKALEVYREYNELAKIKGNDKKRVVALAGIGLSLLILGRLKESVHWFNEAVNLFNKTGSSDWQLRAYLYSNLSYVRILLGDILGLDQFLLSEEKALRDSFPALLLGYRSTLGEYYLATDDASKSLDYFEANLNLIKKLNPNQSRDFPSSIVINMVQALIQLKELEKAKALAQKQYYISRDSKLNLHDNTTICLAYGMILAILEPQAALEPLNEALIGAKTANNEIHISSVCIHLAKAYLELGNEEAALHALEQGKTGLKELSTEGFRVFAGLDDYYGAVYNLWKSPKIISPLRLKFLGDSKLTLHAKELKLTKRWKEIIAILALSKDGISLEKLLLEIYGEDLKISTLKATISKLRKVIPISRPPYKIEMDYYADFIQFQNYLNLGDVRKALELYNGPLLSFSEAPGIIEHREVLEEALRQAVLNSGDLESMINLCEKLEDDFELWESCLSQLAKEDPRYALFSAKFKKLKENWEL